MFPESFAQEWIEKLTKPGDVVLDPFCGRGTAPFQALLMERRAVACDTNPVAYCLTMAKVRAPLESSALRRLGVLERGYAWRSWENARRQLPEFFHLAFHRETLRQLLYLRSVLCWRRSSVDCMLAALALGSLHGEVSAGHYFSNQMPRTISTKPAYSVRFWEARELAPPERDTFGILRDRIRYRYESEPPRGQSVVLNMDMRELPRVKSRLIGPIRCVVTSPPYLNVTDFVEDQWLRLWFLGGEPRPRWRSLRRDDRHRGWEAYWRMIADMWRSLGQLLAPRSAVVIRLGVKGEEPEQIVDKLSGAAVVSQRTVRVLEYGVSEIKGRQTGSFRPGTKGCRREVDVCYSVR